MLTHISDSELVLIKLIWKNGGEILFSEIIDLMAQEKIISKKNVVLTHLSRLVDKEFLYVIKIGRRNKYIARYSENEYRIAKTKEFIDRVYKGNVKELTYTLQGLIWPR